MTDQDCNNQNLSNTAKVIGFFPAIVFEYKNIDYAAAQIASAVFAAAGQHCTLNKMVIVHRNQAEELKKIIVKKMKTYVPSNGIDPNTIVKPIIIKVESWEEALKVVNSKYVLTASLFTDNLVYRYEFMRNMQSGAYYT